jgi:hypothetical protein
MRCAVPALALLLAVFALGVFLRANLQPAPQPPPRADNLIPKLQKVVAELEKESALAVTKYEPATTVRIDDLSAPAATILRRLPGVVQVEVAVIADHPNHRIVHLRDWHFVPKDLYSLDMKTAKGRELAAKEIEQLHQELLLEVEAVQLEQMDLLRCLIKHHGLKRLYCEGLTPRDMPDYKARVAVLRDMEQKEIPELRRQLADARDLLNRSEPNSDRHDKAKRLLDADKMRVTSVMTTDHYSSAQGRQSGSCQKSRRPSVTSTKVC